MHICAPLALTATNLQPSQSFASIQITSASNPHTHPSQTPQLIRQDDGSYVRINPGRNILQLLQDLGQFNTLLAALKVGPVLFCDVLFC